MQGNALIQATQRGMPHTEPVVSLQEGEMRPQLLDRFGMCVNVTTMMDSAARTQMVLDKIAYEQVRGARARVKGKLCRGRVVSDQDRNPVRQLLAAWTKASFLCLGGYSATLMPVF